MRENSPVAAADDGVLVIDKPPDWTSHDVVAKIRRITGQRRVGHAGTLDPAATGVLVVCVGVATRLVEYLADLDKAYSATIHLGVETETWDAEGDVVESRDASGVMREQVEALLSRFTGQIDQVPPMYSALKRDGQPLYRLARQGITVERQARPVTIYSIVLRDWSPPQVGLDIVCSKGTYVRSLAHDLGVATGTGAHLAALRRTAIGHFGLQDAIPLDALSQAADWHESLISPVQALLHLPAVSLDAAAVADVRHGRQLFLPDLEATGVCRALDATGELIAILEPDVRPGRWRPAKVLSSSS